jgi:CubicO group peptidase (beta-lactamase class C family)
MVNGAWRRPVTASGRILLLVLTLIVVGCTSASNAPTTTAALSTSSETTIESAGTASVSTASDVTSSTRTESASSSSGAARTVDVGELNDRIDRMFEAGGAKYDELIRALLVVVDGEPLVERFTATSGPEVTSNVFSVTKSVMSILIGIAIEEGDIAGVDTTLAELLPDRASIMAPGVGEITLRQVLTMTGGLQADTTITDEQFTADSDWIEDVLSRALEHEPNETFSYSSPGSHLLSAILQRATGKRVLDYAREKLFGPLGINTEPAAEPVVTSDYAVTYDAHPGFAWPVDPQGHHLGHSDLKITAADMAKLGQLYLDLGRWKGVQIVPETWVRESTSELVATGLGRGLIGYGYQWWVIDAGGHPAFAALGAAGQLIEVVPDLELVVVVSGIDDPAPLRAENFADLVTIYLIPAMGG